MPTTDIPVRVRQIRQEAETVLSVELAAVGGAALPPFEPGAHVDLVLAGGHRRSYSLYKPYSNGGSYAIAVHRDPDSQGGSRYVHETMRVGETLTISAPKNNFILHEDADESVLIAGGIGITPTLCMVARLNTLGRRWTLYYAARSRATAAFLEDVERLAGGGKVVLHFDDESGGALLNLEGIVAASPRAHFYCCGPVPMLAAYEKACAKLPREQMHVEYFSASEEAARDGGFEVVLNRSGLVLEVPAGRSILDVLLERNVSVAFSCNDGVCGTCETRVIEGTPDHRDAVLTDEEKAAGDTMMVCCSGSKSHRLVLDL